MIGFSAIYGLVGSGFPVAVYYMMVERYDATQHPARCFLWGSGAPIGITLCNIRLSTYFERFYEDYPGCIGGRSEDITDRVLPLQGILVSMVSLGTLSVLDLPATSRRIQGSHGNFKIQDIWCCTRHCTRRTWKKVSPRFFSLELYINEAVAPGISYGPSTIFLFFVLIWTWLRTWRAALVCLQQRSSTPTTPFMVWPLLIGFLEVQAFAWWERSQSWWYRHTNAISAILLATSIILRTTGLGLLFNIRNELYFVNRTYWGKLPFHAGDFIGLFETHQLTSICKSYSCFRQLHNWRFERHPYITACQRARIW